MIRWGTTTADRSLTRLSCRKVTEMWFDLMMSYRDIGTFLSGFSILSLILYFVTSSDSGSLVIDSLASNGHPEPPRLQRLLWALLGKSASTKIIFPHFIIRGNHCYIAASCWRSTGFVSSASDVNRYRIHLHSAHLRLLPLALESSQGIYLTNSSILSKAFSLNQELYLNLRTRLILKYWTPSSQIPFVI